MIGLEGNVEPGQIREEDFLFPLGCFELLSVMFHFFLGTVKVVLIGVDGVFGLVIDVLCASSLFNLVKLLGSFNVRLSRSSPFLVLQLNGYPLANGKVWHD